MNRTEELRNECIEALHVAIMDFERHGNAELDGDFVIIDYITAKRMYELLKRCACGAQDRKEA